MKHFQFNNEVRLLVVLPALQSLRPTRVICFICCDARVPRLGGRFMRQHTLPALESRTTVLHAKPYRASPRSRYQRLHEFAVTRGTFWSAALLSSAALLMSSPATAQFACSTTPSDITCTNNGTAPNPFANQAIGTNQNATTTNSGTAAGFQSITTGGGNATATNSGTNSGTILAFTTNGGNATATNSGTNSGDILATTLSGGSATASNSGSIIDNGTLQARTLFGGNATASNTGFVAGGIAAITEGGGNATATNAGNTQGGLVAETTLGGNAVAVNSGTASASPPLRPAAMRRRSIPVPVSGALRRRRWPATRRSSIPAPVSGASMR